MWRYGMKLNSAKRLAWVPVALGLTCLGACKNVVRADAAEGQAARSPLDYSFVRFAAHGGDRVLSSGEYTGYDTRAGVIDRAQRDLRQSQQCDTGTQLSFCESGPGAVDWIQLFMPDGSSCGVGPIPKGVHIKPCAGES